ncbi:MAG: hypothetical protein P4L36_07295 [Holophaga sp.]|nr:hypothetical protein [Holophaga sp.]
MRRLFQVFALLLVILSGSMPGLTLPVAAQPEPCRCGMPMDSCPMKMPVRTGSAPGGLAAPVSLVTAASRLAQAPAQDARREASPFPQAACPSSAARLLASGPALLARPGPTLTPPTPARLSVFRI